MVRTGNSNFSIENCKVFEEFRNCFYLNEMRETNWIGTPRYLIVVILENIFVYLILLFFLLIMVDNGVERKYIVDCSTPFEMSGRPISSKSITTIVQAAMKYFKLKLELISSFSTR